MTHNDNRKVAVKLKLSPMMTVILIVLIIFAGIGIYSILNGSALSRNDTVTVTQLKEIIEPASDLIVTRYRYKDVEKYETYKKLWGKKVPFTTDKELYSYEGQISVGFDVSDIDIKKVDSKNKKITISLPEIKIIANEIDTNSFKLIDSSDSIFNSSDLGDYTALFNKLKESQAKAVMSDDEFLEEAQKNARTLIRSLFAQADVTKDYTIVFE